MNSALPNVMPAKNTINAALIRFSLRASVNQIKLNTKLSGPTILRGLWRALQIGLVFRS